MVRQKKIHGNYFKSLFEFFNKLVAIIVQLKVLYMISNLSWEEDFAVETIVFMAGLLLLEPTFVILAIIRSL